MIHDYDMSYRYSAACEFKQAIDVSIIRKALNNTSAFPRTIRIARTFSDLTNLRLEPMPPSFRWGRNRSPAEVAGAVFSRHTRGFYNLGEYLLTTISSFAFRSRNGIEDLMRAFEAGAWQVAVTEHEFIVVLIPALVKQDESSRLHCATGPALRYLNTDFYFWHGVEVSSQMIEYPDTITRFEINREPNVEIRRALIEIYGAEHYLRESNAECIDSKTLNNRVYRLYHLTMPGDEPIHMIKVTNATPEPDGTFKDYWLRVPPHIIDAIDAVAWTFNLANWEYPALQFES